MPIRDCPANKGPEWKVREDRMQLPNSQLSLLHLITCNDSNDLKVRAQHHWRAGVPLGRSSSLGGGTCPGTEFMSADSLESHTFRWTWCFDHRESRCLHCPTHKPTSVQGHVPWILTSQSDFPLVGFSERILSSSDLPSGKKTKGVYLYAKSPL